jgi:hypothetical protein
MGQIFGLLFLLEGRGLRHFHHGGKNDIKFSRMYIVSNCIVRYRLNSKYMILNIHDLIIIIRVTTTQTLVNIFL